jgi:hypothetical protein
MTWTAWSEEGLAMSTGVSLESPPRSARRVPPSGPHLTRRAVAPLLDQESSGSAARAMLTAAWSGLETVWYGPSSSEAVHLGCEAVMEGAGASGGVAAVALSSGDGAVAEAGVMSDWERRYSRG